MFELGSKDVLFAYISVLVFVKNKPYTDDVIKSENKRTTVDCGLNLDKGGHLPKLVARNGMFHNQDFMITKLQLNIQISRLANGNTGKDKSLCCTIGTTGKGEIHNMATNNKERKWSVPSKRAAGYASERRNKVHEHGAKEGKQLTDYEAGLRSGYLQAQSDHAGLYKYKKALGEGKSKSEARTISRTIGKKK